LTPADEVVGFERRVDVEDGDGYSTVQVETLDKHPRNVGQHRVPVENAEQLAQPVLQQACPLQISKIDSGTQTTTDKVAASLMQYRVLSKR